MFSKTSSQRTSLGPNLSVRYLFFGKHSVPTSFSRPSGKSMYITGFFVSSWASEPCSLAISAYRPPSFGRGASVRQSQHLARVSGLLQTPPTAMRGYQGFGGALTILPAAAGASWAQMLSRNLLYKAPYELSMQRQ